MDLDPFLPLGIDAATMRLLDVFLLHCLLADSPPDSPDEIAALSRNQDRVAARGREPGLRLERGGSEITLVEWAEELLDACEPIATALDAAQGTRAHAEMLGVARAGLQTPSLLPSARVIEQIRSAPEPSYVRFVRERSAHTQAALLALPYSAELDQQMLALAAASVAEQARIEAADTMPFEIYRQEYLSTRRLGV
jgi:glutamate--cysteine ligase